MQENNQEISTALGDLQLLLAEKRTALALMRTGIAVLALPLSVLSLLVATSKYYEPLKILSLLVPLAVLLMGLVVLGGYLIVNALRRLHRYDELIEQIKTRYLEVAEYVD